MCRHLAVLLLSGIAGLSSMDAIGFGNGVKIGEVDAGSAILWTRLTASPEAQNQTSDWKPDAPNWLVPGLAGKVRFLYQAEGEDPRYTDWVEVGEDTDFCMQTRLRDLQASTRYVFSAIAAANGEEARMDGSFTTAPAAEGPTTLRLAVSTCQEFETRDDAMDGHRIYRSMAAWKPDFFVQTGDTVYYDRKQPLAKSMALARYRWNRMYALPALKAFHQQVPSYWMHDDHDILKDDACPGQIYGDLTWEQGLIIWGEQVPWPEKPYRTYRWGKDLQIWLPEGREFRSSNKMPDGPGKSILGKEQWQWLETSLRESDATYKLYVSATAVVGPDRPGKNDNHANKGFTHEGDRLRNLLSATPGCVVINGDRHWQYHSIDAESGLHEFGCGSSTDAHAGGWDPRKKLPEHQFLRVKGGYLTVEVRDGVATLRHHDVAGAVQYETRLVKD